MGPATLRRCWRPTPPRSPGRGASFTGDVARIWQRHEEKGIEVCWRGGPGYPARLEDDPEAPAVLFCLGDPAAVNRHPTVALVGTRSPTRYGIGVAAQFGADLAALGVSVVSGLALGIDGAAHEGATAAGAPPIAVVAGGLDDPYPRRHARLWARVAEQGAVYSESPAGVRTEKWRFPVRNRLLAMLSDVVVVVESRHRGGAMYTVAAAAERGIPVGAVPGSIRSPTSEGTNGLLADGCFPVCGVADILTALVPAGSGAAGALAGAAGGGPASGPTPDGAEYAGPDRALFDALSSDPVSLDHLVRVTGLELPASVAGSNAWPGRGGSRHRGVVGEDVVCDAVEGLFLTSPTWARCGPRPSGPGERGSTSSSWPTVPWVTPSCWPPAVGTWVPGILLGVRVDLGTQPHRHPTILAREMTTFDRVSGGRAMLAFTPPVHRGHGRGDRPVPGHVDEGDRRQCTAPLPGGRRHQPTPAREARAARRSRST